MAENYRVSAAVDHQFKVAEFTGHAERAQTEVNLSANFDAHGPDVKATNARENPYSARPKRFEKAMVADQRLSEQLSADSCHVIRMLDRKS